MTNAVNLAALGMGGIDTTSLVSNLVSIEEQPTDQLQTQQQNVQSAQSTISSFSSSLSSLASAAQTLSDPTTFSSMTATSSDPSIVATASGGAPAGQWNVSVSSIAQAQRTLSNGFASTTTPLGVSGNLTITLGSGPAQTITVSPTDTLSDIAGEIASSGLRVQSSIVYDGSNYHLLVSGLDTGQANGITFDESGLSSPLGLSVASNTIQSAQNANLTVGGIAVTSASNQITNAIPGVTFAVTQPTTTAASIQVNANPSAIEQNVQAFVTAYNAVVSAGHTAAGYGSTAASNTLLQGDQAVDSSLDQLGSIIGEALPGATGNYTTLDSVGIALNADGTLSLDTSTLSTALASDPTDVQRLFVTDSTNDTQGLMGVITSMIDSTTSGPGSPIQAELNAYSTRNNDLSNDISNMQDQTTAYQTQLQNTYAQMNATLATYRTMAAQLSASEGSSSSSSSSSSSTVL